MKKEKIIRFIFNVFTPLILGSIIGLLTMDSFSYLEQLNRKIVVPPIVFPIVWSILYLLQGIWYYLYKKIGDKNEKITQVYWLFIIVNLLFTPLLFVFHLNILALIDVILLMILIGILFVHSLNKKYKIAYLYIPYLLWLVVAFSLMIDIVVHN